MSRYSKVIDRLLALENPIVRLKVLTQVLEEPPPKRDVVRLEREIRECPLVRELLSGRRDDGTIPVAPYTKWNGAHWVLVALAEIMYPRQDEALQPLREQVLDWILGEEGPEARADRLINGLWRIHASMQGNVVFALVNLGLATTRVGKVVADLLEFQWPDGGWNCDKSRKAHKSSFNHTVVALRGLIAYGRTPGAPDTAGAIQRASEVLLSRRLLFRLSNGEIIDEDFVRLAYPYFYFYTYLFGLKVLGEGGLLGDPRCAAALDLLESRYVDGEGFKADRKEYHHSQQRVHRYTPVRWEAAKIGAANAYLTTDALIVLRQSGRLGR
ncbi:MAG: hypothetical protein P4L84_29570 [Isosphaeraceae bacterium]|nr:hypothetical protein [Isosphaeraceae bacterium]